jgi:hypothetical protein
MYVSVVCETVIDVTPFLPCRRPRQAVVGAEADVEPPLAAAPLLDLGHREAVVAGVHLLDWLVVVAAGHGYVVCGSIARRAHAGGGIGTVLHVDEDQELLVGKDILVGAHGEAPAWAGAGARLGVDWPARLLNRPSLTGSTTLLAT